MKIKFTLFVGVLFLLSGLVFVDAASAAYPTSTARNLPASYDAGDRVEYTIDIDVDQATTLTVNENLPAGWSNATITAVPSPSSTSPVYDGETGVISWLFSLLEDKTTITISVDPPSTCGGDTTFDGNISYDSVVATTVGDTDIICNVSSYNYYCDNDGDTYISASISDTCSGIDCVPVECQLDPGNDCNDNDDTVFPGADDSNCNGIDDDCDGSVDEDYITTPMTCGVGACAENTGQIECQDGSEVDTCDPFAGAAADDSVCNGIDDDCDGSIDEDYVVTQTDCGLGECATTGDLTCVDGGEVDSCTPLPRPEDPEATCEDNLDNDCDGLTDEFDPDCPYIAYYCDGDGDNFIASSMTDACLGESCVPEGCLTEAGDDCNDNDASINPGADDSICNGIDENCDGTADDGYVEMPTDCGIGECYAEGNLTCVEGLEADSCTPLLPQPEGSVETCNDEMDNDCDGAVDIVDSDCGPEITVIPERVDFGCVDANGSESITLKITNTGNAVLNTLIAIEDEQFAVLGDDCSGYGIDPNDPPCMVEIAFAPESDGEADSAVNSTDLTITSAEVPEITKNVPLRGTWIVSNEDTDSDCIPNSEEPGYENNGQIATPDAATGTGKITIDTSSNPGTSLTNVQSISDDDPVVNQAGKPAGYEFTDGLVSFIVEVANDGDTVNVDITFPSLNPDDDNAYYKVDADGFHVFSGAVFNGNTVTLTLTDGGAGDEDGDANGLIVEPGGVGSQTIPAEICDDGIDNDGDGDADCADSDCAQAPNCAATGGGDSGDSDTGGDTGDTSTGSGKCFIATAAYGSYMADEVMALREFRDRYLMPNSLGRALVTEVYYNYSPPIADYIANHESLRTITRIALTPIVYSVKYPFVLVGMMAIGGVFVIRRQRRRK